MHRRPLAALAILIGVSAVLGVPGQSPAVARPEASDRINDPVVLSPRDAPGIVGWRPADLVAFQWTGRWRQIPVQVDQRAVVNVRRLRWRLNDPQGLPGVLVYTDGGTFTGRDPDPLVDRNDEVTFMARDLGTSAPADAVAPTGTVGDAVPVAVTDPVAGTTGVVYLTRHDGTLRPDAGRRHIRYRLNLASGAYRDTFDIAGSNPEDSTARARSYALHFSERWVTDGLTIGGVDILDRHRFMFVPGYCERTEDSFSWGGGTFIADVSGPIRAIRSVMGANSGSYTQRDIVMYDARFEVRTYVRVHDIQGGMDLFDYSAEARGMTYRSNLIPAGVQVDGERDVVPTGRLRWEQVNGSMGAATIIHERSGLPDVERSSYYLDTATPTGSTETQCTGDGVALALSGPTFGALPSTDIMSGNRFTFTRVVYVDPPLAEPIERARMLATMVRRPLVAVQPTG